MKPYKRARQKETKFPRWPRTNHPPFNIYSQEYHQCDHYWAKKLWLYNTYTKKVFIIIYIEGQVAVLARKIFG